jgi:acetyltransferase-like isoleucine patch superfamily enzyme
LYEADAGDLYLSMKSLLRSVAPQGLYLRASRARNVVRALQARRRSLGCNSYVADNVQVLGWRATRVGRNSVIGDGSVLNVNHRHVPTTQIDIGASSFIGARSFFSPAELISIGDYCLIGIECRFLGSGHNFSDPFKPYIATGTADEGRMVIGTNCWIGVGVTLLGAIKVGHGSVIGAGSFVRSDIPMFSVAVGNPARVIRRYDPIAKAWVAADAFTPAMEAALPDATTYLDMLRRSHPDLRMPVQAAGKSQGDLP